jgi:hypothetical protein
MRTDASKVGAVTLSLLIALGSPACKKSTPSDVDSTPDVVDSSAPEENPLAKEIRQDFAKKFSCPEDRVEVKVRADIDPVKALAPNKEFPMGTPPDEVKADPGRYEKWKADRQQQLEIERYRYTQNTMFEVTGCQHTQILGCHAHRNGNKTYPNWPDCTEVTPAQPVRPR